MTSSNTSNVPLRAVSSRSASRKPGAGAMTPTLAATGSTTTAAILSGCVVNASSTAAGSLYGNTMVPAATAAGTPALPGMAWVARPEPASTRRPSL